MPPPERKNSVGESVARNSIRFFWNTHAPAVLRLRTAKNWLWVDALATRMLGCSFQVERKSSGRLMPVFQLRPVWKSPAADRYTVTESKGSGVSRLGWRSESDWRPVSRMSCTVRTLVQLNVPTRTGVVKLSCMFRLSASCGTVSTVPSGCSISSGASRRLASTVREKVSDGDQVISRPRSSGFGEMASDGSWVVEVESESDCRRLPPREIVPQPKRLLKFTWLVTSWVLSVGSSAFRSTIRVLLWYWTSKLRLVDRLNACWCAQCTATPEPPPDSHWRLTSADPRRKRLSTLYWLDTPACT